MKNRNLQKVISNRFFSVSGNEITDITNKSIFSLLHRTANDYLEIDEIFSRVYVIANKKSETIANKMRVSPPSYRHN